MKKNIMKILGNLEMPVFKNIDNEDLVYLKSINAFRIEKYKRNKYHEVNYCYGEGESL